MTDNSERAKAMGCSGELVEGIRRYDARIASLGGYGATITVRKSDGEMFSGKLIERGFGGCQPGIQTPDGKRYAIQLDKAAWNNLPTLVSAISYAEGQS
jgi:hypothetical protein